MWFRRNLSLNTTHAQALKAELYAIDITFLVLATLSVAARLFVRIRAKNYGLEDWLAVIAQVCLFVNIGLNAIMIENGLGLQAENLDISNQVRIGKAIYAAETEYLIGIGVVKCSILIMYSRIFDTRAFRLAAWIIGGVTTLWTVLFIFLCIFQCTPIPRAWDLRIPGHCLNLNALWIGNAIPNIITDAIILAMPIYPVWKLRMRRSQRIAVLGIFLLGGFVIIASIYRLTQILTLDAMNLAYTLKGGATFGHVELAVAIMSCCLPTLKPLFMATMRFIGLSKGGSSGGPYQNTPQHRYGASISYGGAPRPLGSQGKPKAAGFTVIEDFGASKAASGSTTTINRDHMGRHPGRDVESEGGSGDDISLEAIRVTHDVDVTVVRSDSGASSHGVKLVGEWEGERQRTWYPSGPPVP